MNDRCANYTLLLRNLAEIESCTAMAPHLRLVIEAPSWSLSTISDHHCCGPDDATSWLSAAASQNPEPYAALESEHAISRTPLACATLLKYGRTHINDSTSPAAAHRKHLKALILWECMHAHLPSCSILHQTYLVYWHSRAIRRLTSFGRVLMAASYADVSFA